jgi:hypothetical protein
MNERPCRSCGEPLRFERTAAGRLAPINIRTGLNHFADCAEYRNWRKGPWRQPSLFDADEPGAEAKPEKDRYPS